MLLEYAFDFGCVDAPQIDTSICRTHRNVLSVRTKSRPRPVTANFEAVAAETQETGIFIISLDRQHLLISIFRNPETLNWPNLQPSSFGGLCKLPGRNMPVLLNEITIRQTLPGVECLGRIEWGGKSNIRCCLLRSYDVPRLLSFFV